MEGEQKQIQEVRRKEEEKSEESSPEEDV